MPRLLTNAGNLGPGLSKIILMLFPVGVRLRWLFDELFYNGQQFSDGAYLFFNTALKHLYKSDALRRKRFFASEELQH